MILYTCTMWLAERSGSQGLDGFRWGNEQELRINRKMSGSVGRSTIIRAGQHQSLFATNTFPLPGSCALAILPRRNGTLWVQEERSVNERRNTPENGQSRSEAFVLAEETL